jgi:hypothetical protein
MDTAFQPLIRSSALRIDFTGSSTGSEFQLKFVSAYAWTPVDRDHHWYRPSATGLDGEIYVEAIRRRNYCRNVRDSATCEPIVRNMSEELGRSVANTAVHEAGHVCGLVSGGPKDDGHSPDAGNFMFDNRLHVDYRPFLTDQRRTKKYKIQRGDTISAIAERIGMHPPLATWRTLYDFQGQDSRRNRDKLRSGSADLIYPNEEIWIPDVEARLSYMRSLELQPKSFTPAQFTTMAQCLATGKSPVRP